MEGLAWLLIKMAALLALAGVVYFAFGWWLRGRQGQPVVENQQPAPSEHIEQIKAAARAAEVARDVAQAELFSVREKLAASEQEVQRLLTAQTLPDPVGAPEELVLEIPKDPAPKPKVKRKPRAKKPKKEPSGD